MIRLGGGNAIEIGSSNRCFSHHLESALSETTASILFVVSHHVQAEDAISLVDTISLAHNRGVKVIVDAAAETDLKYVELGADLVIYSGHKAIGGPTSGIVVGDPTLIAACVAQETGAGRAMKVSKEAISGLLSALERYISGEGIASGEELVARLEKVQLTAGEKLPATFEIVWDKTRPIPRLVVTILNSSPKTAREVVSQLEGANPSIRTRNHDMDKGRIGIDPREMTLSGAQYLGLILRQALTGENVEKELERLGQSQ